MWARAIPRSPALRRRSRAPIGWASASLEWSRELRRPGGLRLREDGPSLAPTTHLLRSVMARACAHQYGTGAAKTPLRHLHPKIVRRRARAGFQLARRAKGGLRGVRRILVRAHTIRDRLFEKRQPDGRGG